jgi:AcrR family transcriptional regulator
MAARRKQTRRASAPPTGSREATKEETRAALVSAGAALFAEEGLDVPSLDAICDRAGFTRGAFYVHFRDREDFIVAVMVAATGHFLEGLLATEGAPLELGQIITGFAAVIGDEGFPVFGQVPMHQVLSACARSKTLRGRYVEIVEETRRRLAVIVEAGISDGRVRAGLDPLRAAGLLLSVALGVGALRELGVDFDAPGHARVLRQLFETP